MIDPQEVVPFADPEAFHRLQGVVFCVVAGDGRCDVDAEAGELEHVLQGDGGEGHLPGGEEEGFALLEGDGGGTGDEGVGDAAGDLGQGVHGAGDDRRGVDAEGAAGGTGGDIAVAVESDPAQLPLLDGPGVVGDDKMGFDPVGKVAEELPSQFHAAGTGDGEEEFHRETPHITPSEK